MQALRFVIFLLFLSTTILGTLRADDNTNQEDNDSSTLDDFPTSLRRLSGRFLAEQKLQENYTCDKYPRVCHLKGSTGKDCCKKKCVNVKTDKLNCGMCGYKCRNGQICCKGICVNPFYDPKNCGGCNIKCKHDELCAYGMCSYA
ncbi:hypothetical protein ACH5RR_014767 [Cinchona calisaya]|uniref:Stigma-specific STIG1-like protein 1 n=1 Tax=Cinchona calisaya TaxID=153742 RepID=A0ABD2ZSE6_9GENT